MIGADNPGTGPDPDPRAISSGRSWTHPSEAGMAHRGRSDRRRTTVIASGVLLGGVCLLLSGLVMGGVDLSVTVTSVTAPRERAMGSVALITAVDDGASASATGVVLDDDGHLLVDASAVEDADELWVRCAGGDLQRARLVATDATLGMSVIELESPDGVPASIAPGRPGEGSSVRLIRAGAATDVSYELSVAGTEPSGAEVRLIDLAPSGRSSTFAATSSDALPADDLHGEMVFDGSGRLAGFVVSSSSVGNRPVLRVAPATEIAVAARHLLSQRD